VVRTRQTASAKSRLSACASVVCCATTLAMFAPAPLHAQVPFDTVTTISPAPRARANDARREDAAEAPRNNASGDPFQFPRSPFRTRIVRDNTDGDNDESGRGGGAGSRVNTSDDGAVLRPRGPVDGDFSPPEQAVAPVDGDFSIPRIEPFSDGADDLSADTRSDADREAFDGPPVGYDPSLFSIDVSPARTERPRQLFRFEPYAPLGIRAGGFVMLPSVETAIVGDSNVFAAPNAEGDAAVEMTPTVRVVSDWNRHAVEFRGTATLSEHDEFSSENDRAYALELRGRLDVTRRTNFEGLVSRSVTQESRSTLDASPLTADRADLTTDTAALTFNHRFNRLSVQLRGSVSREDVSDTDDIATGLTITNDDRDVDENEVAVRLAWEFKPTLFAFAEAAFNRRDVGDVSAEDGLSRDSDGARYRAGLSFGNTDQVLRGEFSLGFGRQDVHAPLSNVSGLLVDANLAWRVSGLTTLLFTASTEIDDTTAARSAGSISRTVGIEARHAYRENLIANVGLSYSSERFSVIDITEEELRLIGGLEYAMNRNVTLFGRYQLVDFRSNEPASDYRDSEVRLGLRLSR